MQNISFPALISWELLKKEAESQLSFIKFWQFFDHISAAGRKLNNLVDNFFGIDMRSLYAKFQLSSFKTKGGDRG